jgi:hypothetical protein
MARKKSTLVEHNLQPSRKLVKGGKALARLKVYCNYDEDNNKLDCPKFKNPITGKQVKVDGSSFKNLLKLCKYNRERKEFTECEKKKKYRNPRSKRLVTEDSPTFKKLMKNCTFDPKKGTENALQCPR